MGKTRERPIIFSAWAISRLLDGTKTQTRRVIRIGRSTKQEDWDLLPSDDGMGLWRLNPDNFVLNVPSGGLSRAMQDRIIRCPFGAPGDRLWVRESYYKSTSHGGWRYEDEVDLQSALVTKGLSGGTWKHVSAIHMPRLASRIMLEITDVWVERLQSINHVDIMAEGIVKELTDVSSDLVAKFIALWDDLHVRAEHRWKANPWVWVIEFKVLTIPKREEDE